MSIKPAYHARKWSHQLSIGALPAGIRESGMYADKDYWLEMALVSADNSRVGLWFEDGTSDLWEFSNGTWVYSEEERP